MNEKILRALVEAGAVKKIKITAEEPDEVTDI